MYNQLTPEIIDQIKAVSDHVTIGADINEDYAKDEMPIYGTHMPDLAVTPRSTQEVADVVKICYDNNIPVTPRGAGTGLAGGCVPLCGGVLIDLSRMNKILSYDLENFVVNIEAGVLLNDLAEDCLTRGMMYPPDPGEKFACVGGNVATNAGGMRAVKYGATRDYVRAIQKFGKGADSYVHACDYDVEGTLIGYNALKYACGEESLAKSSRMKFSTLTKKDIIEAYENKINIDMHQVDNGIARHILDYYFGMNISIALSNAVRKSKKRFLKLSVGRVQTPTLSILVDREKEIDEFVPEPYWVIRAILDFEDIEIKHVDGNIFDRERAEEIFNKCSGKDATVDKIDFPIQLQNLLFHSIWEVCSQKHITYLDSLLKERR